jgi:thioredoxin 2
MKLDRRGIRTTCPSCAAINRLPYTGLDRAMRCAKCHVALAPPAEPVDVDSAADFDALIGSASTPVMVDFWAPWCAPCRTMAPELAKVAAQQSGHALVVKVDTQALPELGERFGIRSIPTLAVFRGGREVSRTSGARPAADIAALLKKAG